MTRSNFRTPKKSELKSGLAVWLDGKSFTDTDPMLMRVDMHKPRRVCGPFLVERVLFQSLKEPRVDIVNPATGDRRSMMGLWLLVPKEEK